MNRRDFFKGWAVVAATMVLGNIPIAESPVRCLNFTPTKSQETAIRSLRSHKETVVVGGNRFGKGILGEAVVAAYATEAPISMNNGEPLSLAISPGKDTVLVVSKTWQSIKLIQDSLFGDDSRSPRPFIHRSELCDVKTVRKYSHDAWMVTAIRSCVVAKTGVRIIFAVSCDGTVHVTNYTRHQDVLESCGFVWFDESLDAGGKFDYQYVTEYVCANGGKSLWTSFPNNDRQLISAIDRTSDAGSYVRMKREWS